MVLVFGCFWAQIRSLAKRYTLFSRRYGPKTIINFRGKILGMVGQIERKSPLICMLDGARISLEHELWAGRWKWHDWGE